MASHGHYKRHVGKHHGYYGTPTYKSWADFRNFLRDMGERPEGTSLDRIDPYGNYCKENCRWVNMEVQCNNKTNNRKVLYNGELIGVTQLSRRLNICRSSLCNRIDKYGMTVEEAVAYVKEHSRKERCAN